MLGIDCDTSGTLYVWFDGQKTAAAIRKCNIERQVLNIYEPEHLDKQAIGEKIWVITKSTVTLPPLHMSIAPVTSINYPNKILTDILLEMKENLFFTIEQSMLQ